jgi:hypothetical protein
MKYIITNTTDKQFIGDVIEYNNENTLTIKSSMIPVERKMILSTNEIRLINSNYCIDIKEV